MNTILASGIVSFGKELITNLTTPKPVLKSSQSVSFNDEFENVQNAKNTKSLSQINQEFVSREDISEFLRSEQFSLNVSPMIKIFDSLTCIRF